MPIYKQATMAAVVTMAICGPASAEVDLFGGKVRAGGYLAQHWQSAFEVDGSAANPADVNSDSGFARLRFGLYFVGNITDRFSWFAELAEEPNDAGDGNYEIRQDLAWIDYKATDDIILRIGNVVITTMNFVRYSDGGSVQSNPLIGNAANDMITAEEGIWLLGNHKLGIGTWDWNLILSKPSFFGDPSDDSGYDYNVRTSLTTPSGFGVGFGYFKTTGDAACTTPTNCTLADGGAFNSLIALGDGDNYDFGSKTLNARLTQAGIVPGIEADIWAVDIMYSGDALGIPITAHGFYGEGEDNFSWSGGSFVSTPTTFSTTDAEQVFYGFLGRIDLTEKIYLVSRYTVSENETGGISSDNKVDRIQVGFGWWIDKGVLLKAEYVEQTEERFSAGGRCTFGGAEECEWDGFITELSVSF